MDIRDFAIDIEGKDWPRLLEPWMKYLPSSFELWFVSRFGDPFIVLDDGSVALLDVGRGAFERLAASREEFIARIEDVANADSWLLLPLVERCVAAGIVLGPDQCYGYKVPPMLGGEYAASNIEPTTLETHYALLGQVWDQVKDLPPGTKVAGIQVEPG